ncbi:nucleoside-diphosphate-sugar epimerase [Streptomyces canus]|uniref:Nucleoside-diphosphate-sugar epimerase n=1 Tax=Streptomyces canus TaxID=58343 RepID=A0AAW8FCU4_9ACTN|nr:nucleoside-diphosphate-sugar epimerase [Streptomyces canus]MDQ1067636.1 nucleoside-diphosphate-sugar epimerase [Streptomyces canus]
MRHARHARRSLCYVDDTIDGVLVLAASDEPGPVNVGGGEEIPMLDLAGSASGIRFVERPVDEPLAASERPNRRRRARARPASAASKRRVNRRVAR